MSGTSANATGSPWGRPRLRIPNGRFLWRTWGSLAEIGIALVSVISFLSFAPTVAEGLGLTSLLRYTGPLSAFAADLPPGSLVILPAALLVWQAISHQVLALSDEQGLDAAQIAPMRQAGAQGWVVDFAGDGYYTCYGPAGEVERFGDLADLTFFVAELQEDAHGSVLV